MLLAAHSEYFRAFILRWASDGQTCNDTDYQKKKRKRAGKLKANQAKITKKEMVVELEIQRYEVGAMDLIVNFFYFGCLKDPSNLNAQLLMNIIRLADKRIAPSCLHNAVNAFVNIPTESIVEVILMK